MSDKRMLASYVLSASIASLAVALLYFTLEITRIVDSLPQLVEEIEPVISQVDEVKSMIQPILTEVAEVRKQIPGILKEVKQTRLLIPPILQEVKQNRELIPTVMTEVRKVRGSIPVILTEVKKVRETVPSILSEVKKTRESIPQLLDRVDGMVAKAGKIGKETGESAVSGIFTGIIKAPFKLVGDLGSTLFGSLGAVGHELTESDQEIIKNMLNEILTKEDDGSIKKWKNPQSGRNGSIGLLDIKTVDDKECREFSIKIWLSSELESHSKVVSCLNDDSAWEIVSRVNQLETELEDD